MTPAIAREFRKLMIDRLEALDPDRKATLALSGGIDSVTILFAMLATGRKPRCYTFHCAGVESEDLLSSRQLARDFDLELIEVPVPVGHDTIVKDVRRIISLQRAPTIKRTVIQCVHPWLYVCPEMKARGDDLILIGFSADSYYCLSRRDGVRLTAMGEDEFKARGLRDCVYHNVNYSDCNVGIVCGQLGVTMEDAYASEEIQEWCKQFTLKFLNSAEDGSRLDKAPSLYAFAEYYGAGGYLRKQSAYQINSKLRDFHDGLLWNPRYNRS